MTPHERDEDARHHAMAQYATAQALPKQYPPILDPTGRHQQALDRIAALKQEQEKALQNVIALHPSGHDASLIAAGFGKPADTESRGVYAEAPIIRVNAPTEAMVPPLIRTPPTEAISPKVATNEDPFNVSAFGNPILGGIGQ
jgi:hypothetical protein